MPEQRKSKNIKPPDNSPSISPEVPRMPSPFSHSSKPPCTNNLAICRRIHRPLPSRPAVGEAAQLQYWRRRSWVPNSGHLRPVMVKRDELAKNPSSFLGPYDLLPEANNSLEWRARRSHVNSHVKRRVTANNYHHFVDVSASSIFRVNDSIHSKILQNPHHDSDIPPSPSSEMPIRNWEPPVSSS